MTTPSTAAEAPWTIEIDRGSDEKAEYHSIKAIADRPGEAISDDGEWDEGDLDVQAGDQPVDEADGQVDLQPAGGQAAQPAGGQNAQPAGEQGGQPVEPAASDTPQPAEPTGQPEPGADAAPGVQPNQPMSN